MQNNYYNRTPDQQAYHLAKRIDGITAEEEREEELRRIPYDMRDRVEYYMQLFFHKKQKSEANNGRA